MSSETDEPAGRESVTTLLGGCLHRWRERNRLPLRSIAEYLGVTCATVSCWESGKRFPSGKHIDAIAEMMNVPAYHLFCPDEPPRGGGLG